MENKQLGLGLSVSIEQAIQSLPLTRVNDKSRGVSDDMLRDVLHYINGFGSKQCWKTAEDMAVDPRMKKLNHKITARSIRSAILALESLKLVDVIRINRHHRNVCLNVDTIRRMITDSCTVPDTNDDWSYSAPVENHKNPSVTVKLFPPTNDSEQTGRAVLPNRTGGPIEQDGPSYRTGRPVLSIETKESKEDNPTPEAGWEGVVSFLVSHGVKATKTAINGAKKSFANPSDALKHLHAVRDAKGMVEDLPGSLWNQCQHPTPLHVEAPKPHSKPNYLMLEHWLWYCDGFPESTIDGFVKANPGRPLEPRLQAIFDSQRSEASA